MTKPLYPYDIKVNDSVISPNGFIFKVIKIDTTKYFPTFYLIGISQPEATTNIDIRTFRHDTWKLYNRKEFQRSDS